MIATEVRPVGRPTLFREEYAEQLLAYFDKEPFERRPLLDKEGNEKGSEVVPTKFPTLARFATMIGVTRDTLYEWSTATNEDGSLKHSDFSYAYKRAKEYQEAILVEGAMAGAFQSNFSIFTAKNVLGWRDKIDQEITGAEGAPLLQGIQVTFVKPSE
jgi:transposase